MVKAGFPSRHTPARRIVLDYYRNSRESVSVGYSLGEKVISPVAVPGTFLVIVIKLFKCTTEFPSPAVKRGRALLKLLVLGAMVSFSLGYSSAFPGD